MHFFFKFISAVSFSFACKAFSLPIEEKGDLREACRRSVAGAYLTQMDRVNSSKGQIKNLEEEIKKIDTALEKEKKKYFSISERAQSADANVDDFEKEQNSSNYIDGLLEAKKQFLGEEKKEQEILKKYSQSSAALEELIKKIFVIQKIKKYDDVFILVSFKKECSKYNVACPLSDEEARVMPSILPYLPEDSACSLYVSFLRK